MPKGNEMREAFREHHLNLYRAAAEIIGPALCDEPRVIVDAACGTGHGYEFLSPLGRYVGLDRSPEALEQARERYPAGEFRHADFAETRWLRGLRPDCVVSLETAEHVDDPEGFLRRIALALPEYGIFVFSVPTCFTRDFDRYHLWDFSINTWRAMLFEAQFVVEQKQVFRVSGSFRDFARTIPTTQWQKLRVALFDLCHPAYAIDRLWNWIVRGRFEWESTLFVCRPARVSLVSAPHFKLGIKAKHD